MKWLFQVYRQDVFTTKDTARRSRNQSRKDVVTTKVTKDTKGSDDQISELRALRDLRGELDFLIARDYLGEQNKLNVTQYPHKSLKNRDCQSSIPRL